MEIAEEDSFPLTGEAGFVLYFFLYPEPGIEYPVRIMPNEAGTTMAGLQVDIRLSCIWQMTSTVIRCGSSCLVVDPGYFPREIEEIARSIPRGAAVEALVFTHSHFDHVVGHGGFPGVPVYASPALAQSVAEGGVLAQEALREVARFDSQYYVARPRGYGWPQDLRGLDDGGGFNVGDIDVDAYLLPGHAPDCLALRTEGILLVGDYLSPCEIPFVDDFPAYRHTLQRLMTMIDRGIETVIPGHGPALSADDARRIAREDLRYIDAICRSADRQDPTIAREIPLPRAVDTEGMRDHHLANLAKAGLRTL
jgi:glyoxylase-like metal-dependent hydrolase (beta-lactamase superfamily II)